MASGPFDPCPSFLEATDVNRLDSHRYRVDLSEAFCIGTGTTVF